MRHSGKGQTGKGDGDSFSEFLGVLFRLDLYLGLVLFLGGNESLEGETEAAVTSPPTPLS